jgi:predicted transcriptional regulator
MNGKIGLFDEFCAHMLAVACSERKIDLQEPKVRIKHTAGNGTPDAVRFRSLEAGVKLLSARNRNPLRLTATRQPQSVSELATIANRAPQNFRCTLRRPGTAGIVRQSRSEGRAPRPELAARKAHVKIDLIPDG